MMAQTIPFLSPKSCSNYQKYVPICLFIKSPCPPVQGGTYEDLSYYQYTYGRNEQCLSISAPPNKEAVSQFVIPAKPRETGREPGSRSL
jgi:hypothetical protein